MPNEQHIDGDIKNNSVSNLQWVSNEESDTPNSYVIRFKQSDGKFRCYHSDTGKLTTEDLLPPNIRKFVMLSHNDNEATDDDLLEYATNFKRWCKELKESRLKIDYSNYSCDYTAVTCTFNRYCKKNYKHHKPIITTEYRWYERCANFGLQYLKEKDSTTKTFSYDFKNQYGLILHSNTCIPTSEGTKKTLKVLPKRKNLDPGFYRVAITSNNDGFRKLFAFSQHNVYLKESLAFAMKHAEDYDVNIELIRDGKPNTYIYDEDNMVPLKSITNEWFRNLTNLRKTLKDNRLLKHLISSCWGHMNANNKIYKSWDEIEKEEPNVGNSDEYDYQILHYYDYGDRECYELLNTKLPYKRNVRLKPWITAMARNLTASIVLNA